jgi:menaquinone-dependent protoporphyrinogen oxidase
MKNIIIYSTKHGFVKKCTRNLKLKLNKETEVFDVASKPKIDLDQYNCIILGGSIYMGRIQKKLTKYIRNNLEKLLLKKVTLFICTGEENESKAREFLKNSFPEELYKNAISTEVFGGQFKLEKLTALERIIIEKIIGIKEDFTRLNEENINKMANIINSIK